MISEATRLLSVPWIGTVAGILGVGLAIFFFLRSKRNAKLAYQIDEFSVVGGASARFPEELEIAFSGTKVARVTSSRIVLWNAGNTTLDRHQLIGSDPLRFDIQDGIVLRSSFSRITRDVNAIALSTKEDSVIVDFEYLDPQDGCAITIIHSGPTGSLSCKGTLKELPNGPTQMGGGGSADLFIAFKFNPTRFGKFNFLWVPIFLGLLLSVAGIFAVQITSLANYLDGSTAIRSGPAWSWIAAGAVYALFPALLLWYYRRRYPAALQEPVIKKPKVDIRNITVG